MCDRDQFPSVNEVAVAEEEAVVSSQEDAGRESFEQNYELEMRARATSFSESLGEIFSVSLSRILPMMYFYFSGY